MFGAALTLTNLSSPYVYVLVGRTLQAAATLYSAVARYPWVPPSSTSTPTGTPTPTTTATCSVSTSLTASTSLSSSGSRTPSLTPSRTPSASVTPSATAPPSATASVSHTASLTAAPTATGSATAPASRSATLTATSSQTVTPSRSGSATPTLTSSPSATLTPSYSPGATCADKVNITSTIGTNGSDVAAGLVTDSRGGFVTVGAASCPPSVDSTDRSPNILTSGGKVVVELDLGADEPLGGWLHLDTCPAPGTATPADGDTTMFVYEGGCPTDGYGAASCVASNDDDAGGSGGCLALALLGQYTLYCPTSHIGRSAQWDAVHARGISR